MQVCSDGYMGRLEEEKYDRETKGGARLPEARDGEDVGYFVKK